MHNTTRVSTSHSGLGRILIYAGAVILVSIVANLVLGLSDALPVLVPIWGIGVAGAFLYLLAQHERIPDVSQIASRAVLIDAQATNTVAQPGQVYAVSGTVTSDAPLADTPYHKGGNYLLLERYTEEFRREESTTSDDTLSWNEESTQTIYTPKARIGRFEFTPDNDIMDGITRRPIPPDPEIERLIDAEVRDKFVYLYETGGIRLGKWTSVVGDRRISYKAVPSTITATLFGVPTGSTFTPYTDASGMVLHNLFVGSLADAVATLRKNHTSAQRYTRLTVAIVEIIAWTVLFSGLNVGAMLGLGADESTFVQLVLGIVCGVGSVVVIGSVIRSRA